jgi:hypothetical protein
MKQAWLCLGVMVIGLAGAGCAPSSFVSGKSAAWKSIMLDKQTAGKYDEAWQKTVHTLSTDYAIAIMDKDSGYLRTEWVRGVSGGSYDSYRARISVRYPDVKKPYRLQYRTDAQWLVDPKHNQWVPGWDEDFDKRIHNLLAGRLGRNRPQY